MTVKTILDLEMDPNENDANARTIREYLKTLLYILWEEGEGFSGKRPLGNSDWQYDLYVPLIRHGIVTGSLDELGRVEHIDRQNAFRVIQEAISSM